jgi:hypothetical protein
MALAVGLAAACHRTGNEEGNVVLASQVAPDPPRVGPGELTLTLTDRATGRPARGAAVRVEADMSHPGMKPVLATAREAAPGRYLAALGFTMAGDWVVLVDARWPDGRTLHRQLDVRGVRPR